MSPVKYMAMSKPPPLPPAPFNDTLEEFEIEGFLENASNVFRPHYTGGIQRRNNHRMFWICV